MAKVENKDNVQVVFENIICYVVFFLCLLLIASFSLIAEA